MKIVSVGEILWDVFPGAEHLGGAPFNFAAHARRLGHEVIFASGVGGDARGRRALERCAALDLSTRFIRVLPGAETGQVTVAVDAAGQPTFTIHRPAAYDFAEPEFDRADFNEMLPGADWVAFGTLFQMSEGGRILVERILRSAFGSRFFYDVNLRPQSYEAWTIEGSLESSDLVKLNDTEAAALAGMFGLPGQPLEAFVEALAGRFDLSGVCVTLGARGCAFLMDGEYVESPGFPVQVADTVGSGDAFSAALLHGIGAGWPPARAAEFANRVGALVASRPGAIPEWSVEEALALRRP